VATSTRATASTEKSLLSSAPQPGSPPPPWSWRERITAEPLRRRGWRLPQGAHSDRRPSRCWPRVIQTCEPAAVVGRITLCGLDATVAGDLCGETRRAGPPVELVADRIALRAPCRTGDRDAGSRPPVLINDRPGNHSLLTPETLERVLRARHHPQRRRCVRPVRSVSAARPSRIRRTAFRFRDGAFCGCNLYALPQSHGLRALTAWTPRRGRMRKRPCG